MAALKIPLRADRNSRSGLSTIALVEYRLSNWFLNVLSVMK